MGTHENEDSIRIFLPALDHLFVFIICNLGVYGEERSGAVTEAGFSLRWLIRLRLRAKLVIYYSQSLECEDRILWQRWMTYLLRSLLRGPPVELQVETLKRYCMDDIVRKMGRLRPRPHSKRKAGSGTRQERTCASVGPRYCSTVP